MRVWHLNYVKFQISVIVVVIATDLLVTVSVWTGCGHKHFKKQK